uniref:Uncharacterized protein n=1 Tax=Arundo donax TaxID=35708 RepID=A0A0A9BPY8_ARUDO
MPRLDPKLLRPGQIIRPTPPHQETRARLA